ncbi:MAG: hypothetical protein K2O58_02740 [Bacteroidales bacterium]|nr:hypothetical protein [Bacteroidales bacterium]
MSWIAECSRPGPASKIPQPDSAAPISTTRFRQPDSGVITLSLSFSISLAPHFLSPVLDFFDMGIHCHEILMSPDSDMMMGDGEAEGWLQGGRKVAERRAAPLELWRFSTC